MEFDSERLSEGRKKEKGIDELVEDEFDLMEDSLLESVEKLGDGFERKIEEQNEDFGTETRAEKLIQKFRESGTSLEDEKIDTEMVRQLKGIENESENNRKLKDADQRFLEMVDEAEQMIDRTMKVGKRDMEKEDIR